MEFQDVKEKDRIIKRNKIRCPFRGFETAQWEKAFN